MKTLLIPSDFSAGSSNAMRYGIMLAKKTGAKAIFFHAAYFSHSTGRAGLTYNEAEQRAVTYCTARLQKQVAKVMKEMRMRPASLKHELLVRFAPFFTDAVKRIVSERKIDLIVTGTHGASGIKKVLFGSNTTRLMEETTVPVLALPLNYKITELREIFYSTDLLDASGEIKRIGKLLLKLKIPVHTIYMDYGWEKTFEETKAIAKLQKSKGTFSVVKANLQYSLPELLNKYMTKQPRAALCLFHKKRKNFIGALLFGNKTNEIALNLKFPLLAFPK